MPVYTSNGRTYNIPDNLVGSFLASKNDAQLVPESDLSSGESNIPKQISTPVGKSPSAQVNSPETGGIAAFQGGETGHVPSVKMPQFDPESINTELPSGFSNKSFPEVVRENKPIDPNILFEGAIERYQNENDLLNSNVLADEKSLPPIAREWLENRKVETKVPMYNASAMGGGVSGYQTVRRNTPEDIELARRFIGSSPEGRAYREEFEAQKKQVDEAIVALKEKIRESEENSPKVNRTVYIPGSSTIGQGGQSISVEAPEDYQDIETARSQLLELERLQKAYEDRDIKAISQFFNELGRRSGEAIINAGTLGLSKLGMRYGLNKALQNPDNELTKEATDILARYQYLHSGDRSIAQDIAKGATDNADFIAQFAATGGIATALSKGAATAIAKKLGGNIAAKAIGSMSESLANAFVRTSLMPSTLATAYELNTQNPGSFLNAYAQAFGQNFIENFSEGLGEFMPTKFRFLGKENSLANRIGKYTGFQGLIPEFAEEQIATIFHSAAGDGQAQWSDLIDPRNQLVTLGTIGIMQLPYATINAGGYASGKFHNIQQKRSINKGYQSNLQNMQTMFGEDTPDIVDFINQRIDEDPEASIPTLMAVAGEETEMTDSQKDSFIKYGLSYLAYSGLNKAKTEEIETAAQEVPVFIEENANPQMGAVISAVIGGFDAPVQIVGGNIIHREDGGVDRENSDKQIFYLDADGNRQVTSIDFIESVSENIPIADAITQATELTTAPIIARQENEEVRPYEIGEVVRVVDGYMGEISGTDEAGNYILSVETPQGILQITIEPRQIVNEDNLRGVENGNTVAYLDANDNLVEGVVDDMYSQRANGLIFIDGEPVPASNIAGLASEVEKAQQPMSLETLDQPANSAESPVVEEIKTPRVFEIDKNTTATENADGTYTLNQQFSKSELGKAGTLIKKLNEDYSDNGIVFESVQLPKMDVNNPFEKPVWGIVARMQQPAETEIEEKRNPDQQVNPGSDDVTRMGDVGLTPSDGISRVGLPRSLHQEPKVNKKSETLKKSAKIPLKPKPSEVRRELTNRVPANLYQATLIRLLNRGRFSRKDYLRRTGYGQNDLGLLKFYLSNDGMAFDSFESDFYATYRPNEYEAGFESNIDDITEAINDFNQVRGRTEDVRRLLDGADESPIRDAEDAAAYEAEQIRSRQNTPQTTIADEIIRSADERRIVDEVNSALDAEIADITTRLQQKRAEYQAAKTRIGNAYTEDNQTSLFPRQQTSDNLFDVPRDFSQSNVNDILEPIRQEIGILENQLHELENSREGRIDAALDNFRSQQTIFDEIARAEAETNPTEAQGEDSDVPFQSTGTSHFKSIGRKKFNSLINRLKKSGLAKDVITDKAQFDARLKEALGEEGAGRFMTLWHGSPYSFKEFSTAFIGTGEGAQAFGWGLYFTESEDIAKWYAESALPEKYRESAIINNLAKQALENEGGNVEEALRYQRELLNESWSDKKRIRGVIKVLETGKPMYRPKKNLYSVEVGKSEGNRPNFMQWYERLSESQLQAIKEQAKKENLTDKWGRSINDTGYYPNSIPISKGQTGQGVYSQVHKEFGLTPKEVSLFLFRAGIDGIQYPTESASGGALSGGRGFNYVIFDEGLVSIKEKVRFASTPKGDIYGFVVDGAVYLDSSRMNANTPIHEFGHLWNSFIKENNPELWARGAELVKESEYWQRVNDNPAYSKLSDEQRVDEAIATAIGDKGEAIVNGSAKQRFLDWLKDVWDSIKEVLGINADISIEDMTLSDFTDLAVGELLSGKDLQKSPENAIFVNENNPGNESERTEARLDNRRAMGGSTLRGLVGESAQDRRIAEAAEAGYGWRDGRATEESLSERWDKNRFLGRLEVAARENGAWINDIGSIANLDRKLEGGYESEVYESKDGKNVIKLNNLNFLNDNDTQYERTRDFDYFVERIAAHNELFPKDRYEIIGFAENSLGEVSVVMSQPFVEDAELATNEQVDEFLQKYGFRKANLTGVEGMSGYTNGRHELSDIKPQNVLVDKEGNLRFIDLDITLATAYTSEFSKDTDDIRFQSVGDVAEAGTLRNRLDKKMSNLAFKLREAYEDQHLAVKIAFNELRKEGTKIAGHDDFYEMVTAVAGKTDEERKLFKNVYFAPMLDEIANLKKAGFESREIENYVLAKHGVERNEVMRAENEDSTEKDYSGITAIEEEVGMSAQDFIADFEQRVKDISGDKTIDALWDKINRATNFAIDKLYKSGLMTTSQYKEIKDKYKYYVPLRGHDEITAEDVYDLSPDVGVWFSNPLEKAKGRTSRAASPWAYIESMATSAIMQGNKNALKQTIWRIAQRDKTGIFSARDRWFRVDNKGNGNVSLVPVEPEYSSDSETYQQNIEKFYKEMEEIESAERNKPVEKRSYIRKNQTLDIGLFTTPAQKEHFGVNVKVGGRDYTVYINANPAIARAITGRNIPQRDKFEDIMSAPNKWLSANYTTRSPLFIISNGFRDYGFSSQILAVKEGAKYAADYQVNYWTKAYPALARYVNGKSDLSKAEDRMLMDFIMNGGRTGYLTLTEVKKIDKDIQRQLSRIGDGKSKAKQRAKDAVYAKGIFDVIEKGNDIVENATRFATFLTSREHGRDVQRSVLDAKDVTINFNRRGTGAYGARYIRAAYLFSNAAIQGFAITAKVGVKHPWRMAAVLAMNTLSGSFVLPMLAYMLGGDDGLEAYMNLSDWERGSNFCIYTPEGFVKIPIPHELRVFHRMGDNIFMWATNRKDGGAALRDTLVGFADLLPLNPAGPFIDGQKKPAEMLAEVITPDALKPATQWLLNRNFMGTSIYNDWADPDLPGHKKAKTNRKNEYYAPYFLVKLSELASNATGGDAAEGGLVSPNPDILNHFFKGYFGGFYTTVTQTVDGIYKGVDKDLDARTRDWPIKTFFADKDDLPPLSQSESERYYNIVDDAKSTISRAKRYEKAVKAGEMSVIEQAKKVSEEGLKDAMETDRAIKWIKELEKQLSQTSGDEQKALELQIANEKRQLIESIKGKPRKAFWEFRNEE